VLKTAKSGSHKEVGLVIKKIFQFIERRFHRRLPVLIHAHFMIVEGKSAKVTEYHPGTVIDMSKRGCCLTIDKLHFDGFYLMKCLEDSELYSIKVKLEKNESEVLGKICWINSYTEGLMQGFKIGIELVGEKSVYEKS